MKIIIKLDYHLYEKYKDRIHLDREIYMQYGDILNLNCPFVVSENTIENLITINNIVKEENVPAEIEDEYGFIDLLSSIKHHKFLGQNDQTPYFPGQE